MNSNSRKLQAHLLIKEAVSARELPPASELDCKECGKRACLYHHSDYDKPLQVTPLCKRCHVLVHTQLRERKLLALKEQSPEIKFVTATELNNMRGIHHFLMILEQYKSIVVTRHGKEVLVIHKPDNFIPICEGW